MSDGQQRKEKKKGRKGRGRGHRGHASVPTITERPGGLQSSSDDSYVQGAVGGSTSKDARCTPEDLSSLQGACAYDDASTADISEVEVSVTSTPVQVPTHQPSRPDPEVVSNELQLLTNHYPIEFHKDATAYKYDVQFLDASGGIIDSKDIHKNTSISAFKHIIEDNERFRTKTPIFDERKFLITAKKLEGDEVRYTVPLQEPRKSPIASVYFKYVTMADLHKLDEFRKGRITERPADEKQILEIILKYRKLSNQKKVGQSFFADGGGSLKTVDVVLDVKEGFYVSVASSCIGSTLNVDADYRAFVKEELVGKYCTELVTRLLNDLRCDRGDSRRGGRGAWRDGAGRGGAGRGGAGRRRNDEGGGMRSLSDLLNEKPVISYEEKKSLQTLFKGLKVYSDHLGSRRSYTITGISDKRCDEITFKDKEENSINMVDYYREKYGKTLRYTALPALAYSKGKFLPMEICSVFGAQVRNNLSENAKAMLIREVGKISAMDRKKSIDKWVHHSADERDPVLRAYGIKISRKMIELMGDVLKPPELQGKGYQKLTFNEDGTWHFGRDKKILEGQRITNWTVIGIVRDARVLEKFESNIKRCADFIGIEMGPIKEKRSIRAVDGRRESLSKELKLLKGKGMEVVFVVLDPKSDYGLLKWLANSQIGIVTQGIKSTNVGTNWRDATGRNILLKLNTKLDGVNYQINREILPEELRSGVMLMGADVTHPSPGDDSCLPSIAAVIGSMDDTFMRYSDDIKLQVHQKATKDSVEEIIYLEESCRNLLNRYRDRNQGRFPKRIIFFRDGVSDGQFEMVQSREIPAIMRACQNSGAGDIPLSMIITKKRGHTRFFCCHHQDARGKTRNVPAGTVVSTEVVSPLHLNWYGVSHQSLAGVSKPTHYTVLSDESQLSPSTLMSFTYFLCYCFGLCARSVSIPTPVYYAHKAALTYRAYLTNVPELQEKLRHAGCGSSSDAKATNLNLRTFEKKIQVHPNIRRNAPQYFLGPK